MSPTQPNRPSHEQDLALLAASDETGWWDEHGRPAPWPQDFWLPDGTVNPDWQQSGSHPEEETRPDPSENHNF